MTVTSERTPISALFAALDEQVKVYRHLLEIVRREKEILVASKLDELNDNNRAKEATLIRIRALEGERIRAAAEMHAELRLNTPEPRLLDIARQLEPEAGERLRSIHSVLELLLRRVQDYNAQNEALVQSALTTITGTMNALKGSLEPKPLYQKQGGAEGPATAGHLVSREA